MALTKSNHMCTPQREHPSTLRRQRIASPNMLFTHPPESTSPFSLLIKSVILLGKVKTFNVRFRNKYAETEYEHDPRSTAEFRELNQLVSGFREGWPKEWRERADAVVSEGGKVDATLYLAALLPSVYVRSYLSQQPLPLMLKHFCFSITTRLVR